MGGEVPGEGWKPFFFLKPPTTTVIGPADAIVVRSAETARESTSDMICTVAELISAASEVVTLEPGDVIPTGTPSGVGAGRGLCLRPGDVVRTTIDGLGTLEDPVIDPSGRTS